MKAILASMVGVALLLGGCSSSDPGQSAGGPDDPLADLDVSGASPEQTAELSDGEVTADEYEAAFQRYRECLSAAGYELADVQFDNHVYSFGVPGEAVDSGVDDECYSAEFRYVDMLWQGTDDVTNSSDTAEFVRECLRDRGIEPADTLEEMSQQLREANIEHSECL